MLSPFILCVVSTVAVSALQNDPNNNYPNERSYVMSLRERDPPQPEQRADIFSRGQARKGFELVMKRITEEHKKMESNVQKIPRIVKKSLVDTQTSMAIDHMKQNADICFQESIQTFKSSSSSSSTENKSNYGDSYSDSNHYDSSISHAIDIELSNDFHISSDYYSQSYSHSSDYDDEGHSVEISGGFDEMESHSLSIDYAEDTSSTFSTTDEYKSTSPPISKSVH